MAACKESMSKNQYTFQKRQRELEKKKKAEAKRKRRQSGKEKQAHEVPVEGNSMEEEQKK